jgi:hypothetical protein
MGCCLINAEIVLLVYYIKIIIIIQEKSLFIRNSKLDIKYYNANFK